MKKPVKTLPDTNTILRYLLADEPELFRKAAEMFEKVRTGERKALILESVLVECVYVLTKYYGVPKREVAEKLKSFLLYKGIVNRDKGELTEALDIFSDENIDFVDCLLCVKARKSDHSLFSFGKKLVNLAKSGV
ncbi:MAG: PIN domain-containing protein [Deltaproteobacteria bacterium]|nr:MAG: PIN domain-containing protein [Deltaproteobacteria bacterium]